MNADLLNLYRESYAKMRNRLNRSQKGPDPLTTIEWRELRRASLHVRAEIDRLEAAAKKSEAVKTVLVAMRAAGVTVADLEEFDPMFAGS